MNFKRELMELVAQLSASDKELRLPVYGTSMWPYLKPGTNVWVKKCSKVYRGDIVLFRGQEKLIIHRVIRVLPDERFVIKGDNLLFCDPVQHLGQLVAKVSSIERKERRGEFSPNSPLNRFIAYFSWPISFVTNPLSRLLRKLKLLTLVF